MLMRLIVAALALFNAVLGVGFLVQPERLAKAFFLVPVGIQGLATLRADSPAFFITAALFALYGAWKVRAAPLIVPICLLGIAISGRLLGIVVDGLIETTVQPMIAEAVMIVILAIAYGRFRRAVPD